jgi:Zn-dependent protease with chaperone function
MTFASRFALVLLAAFFLSSVVTSLIAYACSRRVLRASAVTPREAGALALYRLLPALAALALTVLVLAPGYLQHEQRGEFETVSVTLFALAAAGLALLCASAARVVRAVRRASALRREWMARAERIDLAGASMPAFALDLPFPLVAVLGVARPRLFVSRRVIGECSVAELAAIIEHERAHVRQHDNGVRLMMDAAPDLLSFTALPSAIADRWHRAVEQRADDAAGRRIDLASALVKVARAAADARALELPASALYGGEHAAVLATRIRRLLGDTECQLSQAPAIGAAAFAAGSVLCALALTGAASRAAHGVLEVIVSRLP